MKLTKFAATALLSIVALAITDGTAAASPHATDHVDAATAAPRIAQGIDRGIGFTFQRGSDGTTLDAMITGGNFRLTEDTIELSAADGSAVASLPLVFTVDDQVITLAPRPTADSTTLVADVTAQDIGYWRKTSPRQRSIEAGMGIGAALGGIAGAFVGIVIGIAASGLLIPISLPIGLIVGLLGGMAVGGAAGAVIPNSDIPDQWDYEVECRGSGDYRYCW
ncbi:hypothetical protein [Nocardia sp. NPDC005366]|uniref:hypothetical protein n=1 Tax=Nocardia sp. NPDC005366 TaxID=3156878 RepID=UPI0033BD584E